MRKNDCLPEGWEWADRDNGAADGVKPWPHLVRKDAAGNDKVLCGHDGCDDMIVHVKDDDGRWVEAYIPHDALAAYMRDVGYIVEFDEEETND